MAGSLGSLGLSAISLGTTTVHTASIGDKKVWSALKLTDKCDRFDRPNGPLGDEWIVFPAPRGATQQIVNNKVRPLGGSGAAAYPGSIYKIPAATDHFTVSVKASPADVGGVKHLSGVMVTVIDATKFVVAVAYGNGEQGPIKYAGIWTAVNGEFAPRDRAEIPGTDFNSGDTLALVVAGNKYTMTRNGTKVAEWTDETREFSTPQARYGGLFQTFRVNFLNDEKSWDLYDFCIKDTKVRVSPDEPEPTNKYQERFSSHRDGNLHAAAGWAKIANRSGQRKTIVVTGGKLEPDFDEKEGSTPTTCLALNTTHPLTSDNMEVSATISTPPRGGSTDFTQCPVGLILRSNADGTERVEFWITEDRMEIGTYTGSQWVQKKQRELSRGAVAYLKSGATIKFVCDSTGTYKGYSGGKLWIQWDGARTIPIDAQHRYWGLGVSMRGSSGFLGPYKSYSITSVTAHDKPSVSATPRS